LIDATKPPTAKNKKKAKKKAMALPLVEDQQNSPEMIGAKITEEQLPAQDPSNIPEDWDTP